ncbi:hypothetical membrane protein [Sulfolobus acidocaldarius DSM 639]|nr:hypothetical membrane protein [Sulfolobus acidocaldarius DSM 639]
MSSKRILNFIGISSLSGFIVYSIVKTEPLLLLNTLLLLFSGIYLALSYRMLRQAYISDKIFWSARDRIFIRTFLLAGYAVLLLLFYLSLHFTILSYLTFFLVATYLVFMSVNLWFILKTIRRKDTLLPVSYLVEGVLLALVPYMPLSALGMAIVSLCYNLLIKE